MLRAKHYRIVVTTIIICLAVAAAAHAASLRFIAFCDTLDPEIGAAKDLSHLSAWAQTIASNTDLTLHLQPLSGDSLTPVGARSMLNTVTSSDEDVICFVYTGHGTNSGNSDWPTFTFMTDDEDDSPTFDEVVSILQAKPHRMLLVLADCCNIGDDRRPNLKGFLKSGLTAANYRHLFLDFEGTIRATASSAGQYSLGDPTDGGLFLSILINDLNTLAGNTENLSWETVLSTTTSDVAEQAQAEDELQVPHYVIGEGEDPGDSGDSDPATPRRGLCGATGLAPLLATALGYVALMTGRRTYLRRR